MSRKEKMKVYHGLPKSVTDKNTVFYADFDGKSPNNINPSFMSTGFKDGITGYSLNSIWYTTPLYSPVTSKITVDFWSTNLQANQSTVVSVTDIQGNALHFQKAGTTGKLYISAYVNNQWKAEMKFTDIILTGNIHLRFVVDLDTKTGRVYSNGKLVTELSVASLFSAFVNFTGAFTTLTIPNMASMSDLHISNIDRGDYFPNLPQDFIEGKAIVKPRMGQQQIKGDPMYSQVTELKVPCTATSGGWGNDKLWIPTDSTSVEAILKNNPEVTSKNTNFQNVNSFFKIKGLNGEVISGVIDTDTALCRVIANKMDRKVFYVDTVAGLAVGDTIRFINSAHVVSGNARTITSINPTNNEVTIDTAFGTGSGDNDLVGHLMIEDTASSSSPIVKTLDGTNVVGTWSGLGSTEATFTLGNNNSGSSVYSITSQGTTTVSGTSMTLTSLDGLLAVGDEVKLIKASGADSTALSSGTVCKVLSINTSTKVVALGFTPVQSSTPTVDWTKFIKLGSSITGKDLYVTYALTMPSGNSDFPELPYSVDVAYNELGTEMKPVNEILIVDDFKEKVSGSVKECPHIYKVSTATSLRVPSDFVTEQADSSYQRIQLLDSLNSSTTANTNGAIPQQLFSFNLIEVVERKLGCEIPDRDKIAWLRSNITSLTVVHYGYGANPTGNKLYLNIHLDGNDWGYYPVNHTQSSITYLRRDITSSMEKAIKSDGFVHALAYTDASNGTTNSPIYTDYVSLEVKLKVDSTYTHLYCENKRAREEVCNPVLIQKETKTVKRYVPSKEAFATECTYVNMPTAKLGGEETKIHLLKSDYAYSTTLGSANPTYDTSRGMDTHKNVINRLRSPYIKGHEYAEENLTTNPITQHPLRLVKDLCDDYHVNNYGLLLKNTYPNVPKYVVLKPYLKNVNGELQILLYRGVMTNGKSLGIDEFYLYKLPNAPLIK